ncbi:unnamed protein product [Closterium sp. NIES-54]
MRFSAHRGSCTLFAALAIAACLLATGVPSAEAYDPLDPTGNITIVWDVTSWAGDGYIAWVKMYNYQHYRKIDPPGWALTWNWTHGEYIWDLTGAVATKQGDCSKLQFPGGKIPHSLGVDGYKCTDPFQVNSTIYTDPTTRRETQAQVTFHIVCTYSSIQKRDPPKCCVSLSSFYNDTIIPCASCACACGNYSSSSIVCVPTGGKVPYLMSTPSGDGLELKTDQTAVECSPDGCPISIHYHFKVRRGGESERGSEGEGERGKQGEGGGGNMERGRGGNMEWGRGGNRERGGGGNRERGRGGNMEWGRGGYRE